ncbi:hypothetical protein PVAP13_9NG083473 [Panicum virgatum]|uniref:Uncharacterized protein n=1 Tax=Panicum virgatum TaxID=38727 RepID=A0A8T0MHR0_PANVG|nr:hypothetical protein PVAP13_9NG083473 [Panicum virgatum]
MSETCRGASGRPGAGARAGRRPAAAALQPRARGGRGKGAGGRGAGGPAAAALRPERGEAAAGGRGPGRGRAGGWRRRRFREGAGMAPEAEALAGRRPAAAALPAQARGGRGAGGQGPAAAPQARPRGGRGRPGRGRGGAGQPVGEAPVCVGQIRIECADSVEWAGFWQAGGIGPNFRRSSLAAESYAPIFDGWDGLPKTRTTFGGRSNFRHTQFESRRKLVNFRRLEL